MLEDSAIVALYWARSKNAITETASKYGKYCYAIAYNILFSPEDADESVNDTYLGAWNSIPPHRPVLLKTYLGKLARRISLKKWRDRSAEKRGGGEIPLVLDELAECIALGSDAQTEIELSELTREIDGFLSGLPAIERNVFVLRYWHIMPIENISAKLGFSRSKVKSMLFRTRKKLAERLVEGGFLDDDRYTS